MFCQKRNCSNFEEAAVTFHFVPPSPFTECTNDTKKDIKRVFFFLLFSFIFDAYKVDRRMFLEYMKAKIMERDLAEPSYSMLAFSSS